MEAWRPDGGTISIPLMAKEAKQEGRVDGTMIEATELGSLCPVLHFPVPQSLHMHGEGWGSICTHGEV